jgi:hypothetical protein
MSAASVFRSRIMALNPAMNLIADYGYTLAAGRVSDWEGQDATHGHWIQATAGNQPLWVAGANPLLRFDKARPDMLVGPVVANIGNLPYTLVCMTAGVSATVNGTAAFQNGEAGTNGITFAYMTDTTSRVYHRTGGLTNTTVDSAGIVSSAQPTVRCIRYDGVSAYSRSAGVDKAPTASLVAATAPATRSVLGTNGVGLDAVTMDLYFIALFARALSTPDMTELRLAISERY